MAQYVPMDVSVSWLLFVLTMIIYVSTFIVLHKISENFRLYMDMPSIPTAQVIEGITPQKHVIVNGAKETQTPPH